MRMRNDVGVVPYGKGYFSNLVGDGFPVPQTFVLSPAHAERRGVVPYNGICFISLTKMNSQLPFGALRLLRVTETKRPQPCHSERAYASRRICNVCLIVMHWRNDEGVVPYDGVRL